MHSHLIFLNSFPSALVLLARPAWWLYPHPFPPLIALTREPVFFFCESRHEELWTKISVFLFHRFLFLACVTVRMSKLWTDEQFNCPVCLDLPNDPVTIPCGHSYCMACIKDFWSKDEPKGIYSCPQCRQVFCPMPSLSRNTMLAEAVEQLRKGALKADVRDSIRSARGGTTSSSKSKVKLSSSAVACDMCKGRQNEAVKSCLVCMSSYCEAHLKPHQTKKALKQHELIAPTSNLAEKICTQHKYLQEFFCRQCQTFICWLCTSNQHKGHESVSTKVERLEKQVGTNGCSESWR